MVDLEILKDPIRYIEMYLKVLTKADSRGMSSLAPMKLWPAQRYYIENRTHRDVILKGRQMGMSTAVLALNSHACFTQKYSRLAIVTHNQDISEFLLGTVQRFLRNLPEDMKPVTDWHSGTRIRFPKMDSLIHIDSAESRAIGFGETLNLAHLSELSRWPPNTAKDLFAGISQTVPQGGFITVESTPRGRTGIFFDLYDASKKGDSPFKTFFFPWWYDPQYKRVLPEKFQATTEEKQMMEHYKLTPEQIVFRREKISELGDLFYQEYPENDIDCWLSTEMAVFDPFAIRRYLQGVNPGKDEGNNITIWKDVIGAEKYVIGVDVAAGVAKGDFSVAAVFSIRRNEYVARIRGRIPPDLFAEQVMRLGRRYNDAEVGIEKAQHGHSVLKTFLDSGYPNIYYSEDYDSVTKEYLQLQPGWRTTAKSKPIMVDSLATAIRANDIALWSENFCSEAAAYMWDGIKPKKGPGAFDDELDACMIALQLRENAPVIDSTSRYKPSSYVTL